MICKNCGMENEEGSRFCIGCGTKLDQAEDTAAATENAVKTEAEATVKAEAAVESAVETEEAAEPAAEEKAEEAAEPAADAEGATKDVDVDEEENNGASANAANTQSVTAEANAKQEESTLAGTEAGTAQTEGTEKKAKKKHGPILIIVCAAVILAVLIPAYILVFSKPTINLNDYLLITTEGYDGYGSARAYVNWDGVENDYGSSLSFTRAGKSMEDLLTPTDALSGVVDVELDNAADLSNGDTLAYTWFVPEDLSDVLNCKLKYEDGTFDVSDLEEIGSFDAFADIDVEFSGIVPNGTATINYNGSDLNSYDISCDTKSGLSNGDTIEVTINIDEESFARANGKLPKEMSKTYTVSGLEEYITTFSDIPEETLAELKTNSEDMAIALIASKNKSVSLLNTEYAGYILLSAKDVNNVHDANRLYIIYKGDISDPYESIVAKKIYFPVMYTGLLKDTDGNLSWDDDVEIVSDYIEYYGGGYANPLSCYTDILNANKDKYTTECGDGFEIYAEHENIGKLADISDEYKQTLADDAKSKINNYVAGNYDYNYTLSLQELNLCGEYLLIAKNQSNDFSKNNKYIVVYSATVASSWDDSVGTVYFPVQYNGVVKLPDGEYMVTEYVGILGRCYFTDNFSDTEGYVDGQEMFQKVVTANRGDYTYEVSDGLKQFGE